jgi:hypothetical protein
MRDDWLWDTHFRHAHKKELFTTDQPSPALFYTLVPLL